MLKIRFRNRIGTAAVAAIVAVGTGAAQTKVDLRSQSRSVDFADAPFTRPAKTGTTLPASCSAGEMFIHTGAASGSNVYVCVAPDEWASQTGTVATQAEAEAGISNSVHMTPLRSAQLAAARGAVAKKGTVLPSTCTDGELFIHTSAPAGQNTYACTAPNMWQQQGGITPAIATEEQAEAGAANAVYMTPLRTAQAISAQSPIPAIDGTTAGAVLQSTGAGLRFVFPMNPGSGRLSRYAIADGTTAPAGVAMPFTFATNGTLSAIPPTAGESAAVRCVSAAGAGELCRAGNFTGVLRLGTNLRFDVKAAIRNVTGSTTWIGLVEADPSAMQGPGGTPITVGIAAFRVAMDEASIKCVLANGGGDEGTTVADSGVAAVNGQMRFSAFFDDADNNYHWYIDDAEVCSGMSLGSAPAARNLSLIAVSASSAAEGTAALDWVYSYVQADR